MRLLFVTHHRRYKTVYRSAAWAPELARRGHEVTLVCISHRARWALTERREHGVNVVETPDLLPGALRSGWDPWDTLRRLLYLRGQEFDLVHAFETRPATIYPVLALLRRRRIPLVVDWNDWWGRGGLIEELRPPWYRLLFGGVETWYEEHFRPRADVTTVISTALGERARGLGVPADRIFRIPGGVDPDTFRDQDSRRHRPRFGLPDDRFIAMFSAADATMDLGHVLASVRQAAERCPDLLLVMTGNRPADFDRRLAEAGVADRVLHLGFLPLADLPDVLSCADVFLLPFLKKVANVGRWPHKLGEYLACGRPVISHAVGDVGTLFSEHRIGGVAPETDGGMAEWLVRLAGNPGLRADLGANARRLAVGQFAWPRIVDRVERAYAVAMRTGQPGETVR